MALGRLFYFDCDYARTKVIGLWVEGVTRYPYSFAFSGSSARAYNKAFSPFIPRKRRSK